MIRYELTPSKANQLLKIAKRAEKDQVLADILGQLEMTYILRYDHEHDTD